MSESIQLEVVSKNMQKRILDQDGAIAGQVLDFLKNGEPFKNFEKTQLISRKNKIFDRLLQDFTIIQALAKRALTPQDGKTLDLKRFFKTENGKEYQQSFIDLVHILGTIRKSKDFPQYEVLYNNILNSYGRTGITAGEPSKEAKKAAYSMAVELGLISIPRRIVNSVPWKELAICAFVGIVIQLGSLIPGPVGEGIGLVNTVISEFAEVIIDSIGIHGILGALAAASPIAKWVVFEKLTAPLVAIGQGLHPIILLADPVKTVKAGVDFSKTPKDHEKLAKDDFKPVTDKLAKVADFVVNLTPEVINPKKQEFTAKYNERVGKVSVSFAR